jgi:general secretion pathway protein G
LLSALRRRLVSVQSTSSRDRRAGFTLVELLVVLVILGLLVGFAAPQVFKFLGKAKTDAASVQISRLGAGLDLYRLEMGSYPSTDDGLEALIARPSDADRWNGPYIDKAAALLDPWRNPYQYRHPGEQAEYDLYSLGADGQEGGDGENADLKNW